MIDSNNLTRLSQRLLIDINVHACEVCRDELKLSSLKLAGKEGLEMTLSVKSKIFENHISDDLFRVSAAILQVLDVNANHDLMMID